MNKLTKLVSFGVVASIALVACGGASAPIVQTVVVEKEKVVEKVATQVVEKVQTQVVEKLSTVVVAATAVPAVKPKELTLWHAYGTGSAEEQAMGVLAKLIARDMPTVKLNVLQIPFDQVYKKYETEVAAGGGPDLYIAPDDNLGSQVRGKLVADITDLTKGKLDKVSPVAVKAHTIDGKLYAVPQGFKAVALYYNKDKVKELPKTTDDLLKAVQGGLKIGINPNCYHNYGFYQAFGGKIFGPNFETAAVPGTPEGDGVVAAFKYLKDLKAATGAANFFDDGGKADAAFREGKVDMIINGPWTLGDYKKSLGDKLGVVAMPGMKNPAGPLVGVDGFYINPNGKNQKEAVDVALYLTSQESQGISMDLAGAVPVRSDVTIKDPLIKGFYDAMATGVNRPQVKELDAYWGNFCGTYDEVLKKGDDPVKAVQKAADAMKKANGK